MFVIVAVLFWISMAGPVAAHDHIAVGPETLWRSWNFDLFVIGLLFLTAWLYASGVRNVWAAAGRRRGVTGFQALWFAAGMTVMFIALVSPLDPLGGTLLSAHMTQHGLLVAIAPPLLLLGRPGVAFAWCLPANQRPPILNSMTWRSMARLANALSAPLVAAVLHGLALWIWHAPAAFDLAVASHAVHALEHVSFFGTGLLFWRSILGARSTRRASAALGPAVATLIHGGLLGALITLAPSPLYSSYDRTEIWGLSSLADQQLAGLLMWVPMGVVYLAACLLLASRVVAFAEDWRGVPESSQRVPNTAGIDSSP